MTSFISALSLFVLALVSGCFTLPITENPLSDTSSPFYNDITTDKPLGERMVFDDATMSSTSVGIQRSSDESMGFETSSMFEDATREPRMLEDVTQELHMFEDATREPRMFVDMATEVSATFVPTTERSFHQRREMKDSSMVTVEPTTERAEFVLRDFGMDSEKETEVATESNPSKREFDDLDFTTSNSVTGVRSSEQLFATMEPETSSMDMQMDFTTNVMPSFTSTSSAVAPELYTREPSTTRKYTGLLADKEDQEEEKEHNDEEPKKPHGKHEKDGFEMEEHEASHEKHEEVHGKHKKPHEKHESESEEHKHDEEVKKDKKHKKIHSEHGKDELEMEEPKKEVEKESNEEKKVSDKHRNEEIEKEEPKQEGDKDIEEEKKVSEKYGKEEPKQEGDKEIEEGRQPEKHDEDNFEKDIEATEPKELTKKRPTTFRKAKVESDDGIQYPKAVYDQDAWDKIPRIPSDFAVLDETSDVVTTFNKLNSLYTVESHTEESKLNQGEESSRAE